MMRKAKRVAHRHWSHWEWLTDTAESLRVGHDMVEGAR